VKKLLLFFRFDKTGFIQNEQIGWKGDYIDPIPEWLDTPILIIGTCHYLPAGNFKLPLFEIHKKKSTHQTEESNSIKCEQTVIVCQSISASSGSADNGEVTKIKIWSKFYLSHLKLPTMQKSLPIIILFILGHFYLEASAECRRVWSFF